MKQKTDEDALVGDIISRLGKNCVRKTHTTGKSAKDEIRRLLGAYMDNGRLPDYTIEEISTITKKSEVNVRTMLSDLRSPKYCGLSGVFLTERVKRPDGKIAFRFIPPMDYKSVELITIKEPESKRPLIAGLKDLEPTLEPAGKKKKPERKVRSDTGKKRKAVLDDSVLDGLHK